MSENTEAGSKQIVSLLLELELQCLEKSAKHRSFFEGTDDDRWFTSSVAWAEEAEFWREAIDLILDELTIENV